ncbi:response regulator transcription factor [Sagittula salina]|uniref:Response regulator n=1 Tax=Sagittula salina TaxID=2820268 RepID=A0A940S012_9RHOB|nr:response regulator [Sagittula salina]MBP0482553.1 response regulator [Sagittula salina]
MTQAYIVDDREVDRYTARRRLAKSGRFTAVHEAEDGRDFLDKLYGAVRTDGEKGPLVLMDIRMPLMDGFETAEALREKLVEHGWPKDVVVVIVSSSGAPMDRQRAMKTPLVRGYFEKPLRGHDVEEMLKLLDAA